MNQQIDGYKNVLWELTWKLELFTHIVPVPMAIYFSGVTGNLVGIKEIMMTIFTGGLAGTLMVLMGIAWRTYILKKLFRSYDGFLEKGGTEKKILMKLKTKIINHPFHEGRMIVFRWCFGVPLTHILFILFYKVKPEAHQSIPFLLLYIVPVSYISYILISERVLQKILTNDSFKNLPPLKNKALSMNYFRRLLISFLSVAIMPFCVLGYLMYAMDKGFLKVSHPFLHIGIIGVSMFVPIMVVSYVMAGSLRSGIDKVTHTLKRVSLGDFSERLAVASNDEFGMQAKTLNDIILKLSQMYTEIKDLNQNLERKVEQRTAELKESLEHVKKLKFQQDGDYFLTSLLLKPLGKNEIKSDKVKIDFLIKQKKEFEFKNRVFEIGGDLCLSHSIKLKGKPYIIFI
ncbi:MAG: SpoIIE-like protein phosphatase, partial [Leptospiraceae bacterium]|nr:SpoIIE-like protein phosphatase [Leptospiraceae bacterium]